MKMSTRGRYGLRVMTELARHYGGGPLSVDRIAKHQQISGKYIHLLVTGLKTAGLIRTVRGPNGGYELTRDPASVTALQVIEVLEGKIAPVACVDNKDYCERSNHCAARNIWTDVAAAVESVLAGVTLEELARQQQYFEPDSNYII